MSDSIAQDPTPLSAFVTQYKASGDEKLRLGHIKLPLYRDPNRSLIQEVGQALTEKDGNLLFITSGIEKDMQAPHMASLGLSIPSEMATFAEFLKLLASSRKKAARGRGFRSWKMDKDPWTTTGILPFDVVLVIHMDSSLPADCCLCILVALLWAFDVAKHSESDVRILTMSTGDHYELMSKLVDLQQANFNLQTIDLSHGDTHPPITQISDSHEDEDIVREICEVIEANISSSQLILVFSSLEDAFIDQLEEAVQAVRGEACQMTGVDREDDIGMTRSLTDFGTRPEQFATVMFNVPADCSLLPHTFRDYNQIHVVLDVKFHSREGWHHKSRQSVQFSRTASNQDRWAQMWWIEQAGVSERYLYSRRTDLEDVLSSGMYHHRQIEDAQLGGFISAVYDLQSWGVDCLESLDCFIRFPARAAIMLRRLETQGILYKNGFALAGDEAKAFRTILPLVKYDHRLALFGSIDSGSVVQTVKLQLVSLMFHGIDRIFCFEVPDLAKRLRQDENLNTKLHQSWVGSGGSLAKQGTLWLALALWKRHLIIGRRKREGIKDRDQDQLTQLLSPLLTIESAESMTALSKYKSLVDALLAQNIGFVEESLMQESELTPEEVIQLQGHLFRAFMHQLLMGRNGVDRLLVLSTGTHTNVPDTSYNLTSVVDLPHWLRAEGNGCYFGMTHTLRKEDEDEHLTCMDWTWIPQDVIAEWIAKNTDHCDLTLALKTFTMEVDEDPDIWDVRSQ
ncbi:hypothetical protein F53441_1674 [Fusarium austroafricanum]|uniref:Uncharacterized protein n=1 Tax=Fusarium austroafricanum TaxID=2364996 RepID=A0A8H4NYN8_9HYPO|nr:hypothetical protein F53441_1674 [Fusarium austroafricanum]